MNQLKIHHHTFKLEPLRLYFAKKPLSPPARRLIELPPNEFIESEEEIQVIAACLYVLSVIYDREDAKSRAKDQENVRKWIGMHRPAVLEGLANKVEPSFTARSIDQMSKDVAGMMEELLLKTLSSDKLQAQGH